MALIGNRSVVLKSPGRFLSGLIACFDRPNFGGSARRGAFDALAGIPSGYYQGAWFLPKTAGAMSSVNNASVSVGASGLAYGGVSVPASSSITFTVSDADGQLISSGSGSASMAFTAEGLATASLNGIGSASFTLATNAPLLGAEANLQGAASFAFSGTLQPYAIGQMSGSTVDSSTLTIDAIAAGVLAAALTTPIRSNVKQVNDVDVNGTGATGDEWGP